MGRSPIGVTSMLAASTVAALFIAGCSANDTPTDPDSNGGDTQEEVGTTAPGGAEDSVPPPITIVAGDETHEIAPWSYCWADTCVDGTPPDDSLDLGSPDDVVVEFPADDASFVALLREAGSGECGRSYEAPLTANDDGTFTLSPIGKAGEYEVLLAVRAPEGDAAVSFLWTTPTDGEIAAPEARLAIASMFVPLSESRPDLSVTNLRTIPDHAAVSIDIESADGSTQTVSSEVEDAGCPAGTLRFFTSEVPAPLDDAESPFTYRVTMQLDDVVHEATATWPTSPEEAAQPYVTLEFNPPLPAIQ
ncbi:hypothetical protein IEU95_10480 [Hoyosella rhizosphaerae]|uniref:Uncharacterized protein n=1 Tax=Hoyosella rhizosphaerae TaxID=1755582 RepID=A0A916TZ94_9ACTN|nr:hypothetical protein [Hoyosella rhizosphaerae]MBN4927260.1 hypothetical protein [Hoyosella rhizosphaerae]GGC52690.1 hypothetical protein GCM10011410_01260 [Hoyosella rhizosphaerae]